MEEIDLSKCKKGDILISTHGAVLKYLAPTPYNGICYLDHVVRYIRTPDNGILKTKCLGTRTNDGFVYAKNRMPESDHDIAKVIPMAEFCLKNKPRRGICLFKNSCENNYKCNGCEFFIHKNDKKLQ